MIHKFKKWLSGEITWREEKELRKEATDDSVLADAIEGYEQFPESDHLQKIHQLNKRIRQESSSQASRNKFPLRAIAASFMVLMAAGLFWMVNQHFLPTSSENIAYQIPTDASMSKEAIVSSPTRPPANQQAPVVAPPTPAAPTNKNNSINNDIETATTPVSSSTPVVNERETEVPPSPPTQRTPQKRTKTTLIKEEAIAATPPPSIEQVPPPVSVPPFSEEEGIVQIVDQAPVETSESGANREEYTDQQTAANISLSRQAQSRAYVEDSETAIVAPSIVSNSILLQQYFQENLRYPEEAKLQMISGTLRLYYQLDDTGNFNNIKVIDSLGYGCEEEAIRLLRTAPAQLLVNEVDTISIKFGQ